MKSKLLRYVVEWFKPRFITGLFLGGILGALIVLVWSNVFQHVTALFLPQVEIIETWPKDGETLYYVTQAIEVNFSQPIPLQYTHPPYVVVQINPDIPLALTWSYHDFKQTECCSDLNISPWRFFPDDIWPRFEKNTTYNLRVSGLLIKKPLLLNFRTPSVFP